MGLSALCWYLLRYLELLRELLLVCSTVGLSKLGSIRLWLAFRWVPGSSKASGLRLPGKWLLSMVAWRN